MSNLCVFCLRVTFFWAHIEVSWIIFGVLYKPSRIWAENQMVQLVDKIVRLGCAFGKCGLREGLAKKLPQNPKVLGLSTVQWFYPFDIQIRCKHTSDAFQHVADLFRKPRGRKIRFRARHRKKVFSDRGPETWRKCFWLNVIEVVVVVIVVSLASGLNFSFWCRNWQGSCTFSSCWIWDSFAFFYLSKFFIANYTLFGC